LAARCCLILQGTVTQWAPLLHRAKRNWEVCGEAENGKIAVERVKELRTDVVILDLQMPVMDGLEAARQISRLAPNTAMLMFTMYNCEPSFERGSGRWQQRRSLKI